MADEKLQDIVYRAARGEYDLPETQRDFVWKAGQVRALCDSLYQDYPIGMLLLWDNPKYVQPRRGAPNNIRQPRWIVDGQQRITTLGLLFAEKPYWYSPDEWMHLRNRNRVFVNIDPSTGGVEFSGRSLGGSWKSILASEVLRREREESITELAQQISGGDAGIFQRIIGPLIRMWNIRNKQVPVIQISEKEPEEVAEIFERFNRGGTRIKETDIRFAIIAARNPGWVRDTINPFLSELEDRGWDIPPGYLLQAMTVFHLGRARVGEAPNTFWTDDIRSVWNKAQEAIDEVIIFLWDRGIPAIDLIPSEYTLIPLFALHTKFKNTPGYSFDAAYHWFLLANLEGRYSGAPLEILTKDASVIHGFQTLEEALNNMPHVRIPTRDDFKSLFQDTFRKGEFPSLLLHLLLWQNNARDWLQPITLRAAATNHGVLRPHWHHILPRSWAERNNFGQAEVVANITILTETTNVRRLRARPPWEYVPRNIISQQALEEHFIPEEFAHKFVNGVSLTANEFGDFLQARSELLANAAMKYLDLSA